ncbi:MAG TPA: CocE/NonD family hydrolase [Amycolatopsis sp.]|nr:CocE/NonD family hydrolase [Amycolatopsis sp.]
MTDAKPPTLAARVFDRVTARRQGFPPARSTFRIERDLRVPMRDGISLLTDHYLPDNAPGRGTVLIRTPYGRGLPIGPQARLFAGQGYHVVVQSCRGTFGSGGQFRPMAPDINDGQDAMAWLRQQPWFDGRLATYGASGVGWTQWALLMDPPPELRASIIIAAPHDTARFGLGAGAMRLHDVLTWARVIANQDRFGMLGSMVIFSRSAQINASTVTALPLGDALDSALKYRTPWLREFASHQDHNDPYWVPYDASAALEKVQTPVRLAVGWQDLLLSQTLHQYEVLRGRGVDVTLTIGPWIHQTTVRGGDGELTEGDLDWLAEHLADEPVTRRHQPVRVYVTGAEEWREYDRWPPQRTEPEQVYHLDAAGRLGTEAPQPSDASFVYDPARPTPTLGGPLIDMSAGVVDNRELEAREDVLTYTTEPLSEAVDIIGAVAVELEHSRSNQFADVFVRLCDVDATGRSLNITETFLRLDALPREEQIRLSLNPCAHRVAAGHRLRLQISGGSFPQYLRNQGTGEAPDTGVELRPCVHTVHHGKSRVLLPVLR